MNDTLDDRPAGPQAPPHQQLDRLRRSRTDRYVAGVAGGLGRHFGIDPTVIRVLLVVLVFFGGAGLVVYGIAWLFVPEEGADRARIHVEGERRNAVLIVAAVVAACLAVGDTFSGWHAGFPLAALAVLVVVILVARDRRDAEHRGADAAGTWAAATDAGTTAQAAASATTTAGPTEASTGWSPPPAAPPGGPVGPVGPAYVPPRPRRTGVVWFWPTLALVAIGLGVLAIVDSGSVHVPDGAYPALALAIVGTMLVVGSFVGRPGGLIFLGIVSAFVLAVTTVVGGLHVDGRQLVARPTSAASVLPDYSLHNGEVELDLRDVADLDALAGRHVDVTIGAGRILVTVPRGLSVDLDARMRFAGGIDMPGYHGGGFQDSHHTFLPAPASSAAPLDLDLQANVGQITVEVR